MTDAAIRALLRRDRAIVLGTLIAVAALAWAYVIWLSHHMTMTSPAESPMEMGGTAGMIAASTMLGPFLRAWDLTDFAFVFGMWAAMMIGMMLPSVTPMVLLYATVGRKATESGKPLATTGWFLAGYLSAWMVFSLAATLAQWQLSTLALVAAATMSSASDVLGGALLVAAGLYQWSPLKDTCLAQCQSPLGFLMRRGGFRTSALGSLWLGAEHGAICVGCCWVLMALLFVGGVMNLLWITGLPILILSEKIAPTGRLISRLSGTALAAAGVLLLNRAI